MEIIRIDAATPYDVTVAPGYLDTLGAAVRSVCTGAWKVMLVSDDTVHALYGRRAETSLAGAGFSVSHFVFSHGEASKTLDTYARLLSSLVDAKLDRNDVLVALGGGVTGDLTGFAAATYLRGVRYVYAPTTLLGAVDASVGGKTGVDLPAGKNLVGAFHRPSAVVLDPDVFSTLPDAVFADGMAELIKTGVLFDAAMVERCAYGRPTDLMGMVAQCIRFKGDVVARDERDVGERRLLNLGHTVAHAVELLSDYRISHGRAVAIGLSVIARAAYVRGLCGAAVPKSILNALAHNALPTECPFGADALASAIVRDKKRVGEDIVLVIPRALGHCTLETMPLSALPAFLAGGLA